MSSGLYPNLELVERFLSSYSAGAITQKFLAPCDLDVLGLGLLIGTAPGGSASINCNIQVSPTSQLASVSAYNLWTTANVPAISGANTSNLIAASTTVIQNTPYAVNYPFPGPSGTTAYTTAQSTSQTTDSPVVTPPTIKEYYVSGIVAPDNTYTDLNGVVQSAGYVHAGDVLTWTIAAGTGGAGSAAGTVEAVLYMLKH
jgi:hypothetical protein